MVEKPGGIFDFGFWIADFGLKTRPKTENQLS